MWEIRPRATELPHSRGHLGKERDVNGLERKHHRNYPGHEDSALWTGAGSLLHSCSIIVGLLGQTQVAKMYHCPWELTVLWEKHLCG